MNQKTRDKILYIDEKVFPAIGKILKYLGYTIAVIIWISFIIFLFWANFWFMTAFCGVILICSALGFGIMYWDELTWEARRDREWDKNE